MHQHRGRERALALGHRECCGQGAFASAVGVWQRAENIDAEKARASAEQWRQWADAAADSLTRKR